MAEQGTGTKYVRYSGNAALEDSLAPDFQERGHRYSSDGPHRYSGYKRLGLSRGDIAAEIDDMIDRLSRLRQNLIDGSRG